MSLNKIKYQMELMAKVNPKKPCIVLSLKEARDLIMAVETLRMVGGDLLKRRMPPVVGPVLVGGREWLNSVSKIRTEREELVSAIKTALDPLGVGDLEADDVGDYVLKDS